MEKSLVSIIIPVYNREGLIGETLASIRCQKYQNWECIIVDDGSTDDTKKVILKLSEIDPRIKFYERPSSHLPGGNGARNYGFIKSIGQYVHWFDSDDIMEAENIERKVFLLDNFPQYDYCISQVRYFDSHYHLNKFYHINENLKIKSDLYREYILGNISILNVNPLWRKNVLEREELYDESIKQLQDLDFFSRVIFKNRDLGIINEVLISIRRGNQSITTFNKKIKIHTESYLKVRSRIVLRTPKDREIVLFCLKDVLWCMRLKMSERKYCEAQECLNFIDNYKNLISNNNRWKIKRIQLFYWIFKKFEKGDTKFKFLLKL